MGGRQFTYRDNTDLQQSVESLSLLGGTSEITLLRQFESSYDTLGRRTLSSVKNGMAFDHAYSFGYDAQTGRVSTVTHGNAPAGITEKAFSQTYLANSNLLASKTAPVHTVENTWESHRNVLKRKRNLDGVPVISAITYGDVGLTTDAVNGIGQRLEAHRTYNSATSTEVWKYDDRGQVVDANHSDNTKDRTYAFDGIGNRTSATDSSGTITYTPDKLNQYDAITSGSTVNPVHDKDGNLTDDGSKLYTWDAENRLVEVREKGTNNLVAKYRYDYLSRRVYKETATTATLFVYDGWNLVAEYDANAINGTTNATINSLTRTYTWGIDLSGGFQGAGASPSRRRQAEMLDTTTHSMMEMVT